MRLLLNLMVIASLVAGCNGHKTVEEKQTSSEKGTKISLSDEELMDIVQKETFNYFWEGAEPVSGMARERIHMDGIYPSDDRDVVTTGGSGFGLMAILVGIERGFVSREDALKRFEKVVDYLARADRFHGAWPHWLYGPTGETKPFSPKDDGGDLVETAFLIQGLLTVKQYFMEGNQRERQLAQNIQKLYEEVEWDWYTQGGNGLFWHWSPNFGWEMNFLVRGYNEALVMYILAAASPTHPISKEAYDIGWARNGDISNGVNYYDLDTELDHYSSDTSPVGPLFWAHYSYLGLNPKGLKDQYGDYWKLNTNHAAIHYRHCIENPNDYEGYSEKCWGLTSSYSMKGYAAHRPDRDLGVISPTAALSSMPYTPKESLDFLRFMYEEQDRLIGKYGPYDAFSLEHNWYLPRYLAIDQGPIPVMIENYRSGMLWKWFMKNEDVQRGLAKLGFTHEQ
ncbi:glucoamylase family protein [Flagellimonas allohymeniacidonis]|uniref:Beta-glucosidase n=1 Tax=Flagellimonas allohymeniacidonis TaxID=2517819 RepID=A0A4Q8QFB7_9FLAO|nr:glucoamylase family protein [Allomuricauda hymeniacidonis]TAI48377.1 beta-glucosidase [Allomuricauda hymeniacidonis]